MIGIPLGIRDGGVSKRSRVIARCIALAQKRHRRSSAGGCSQIRCRFAPEETSIERSRSAKRRSKIARCIVFII
jgi:hypothetical protein